MPAWPNVLFDVTPGIGIALGNHLRVVFKNVAKVAFGKNFFPQIGRFQSVGVDGVARSVVKSFVKRQKPTVGPT